MNKSIQGMRALAMLAIFLFHAGLLPNGYFPVTFFFMASGFGIYTAKHALPAARLSGRQELRWVGAKLPYFYAIHLLLFAVSIPIRWQELQITPQLPQRAALALTLTQSWYPPLATGFNNLSWFLSTLLFVYLGAFGCVRLVRRLKHTAPAALALLVLEAALNGLYAAGLAPRWFEPYFSPLYRLLDLALGMVAARFLLERPAAGKTPGGTGPELLAAAFVGGTYLLYLPCKTNLPAVFAPAFFAALCILGQQRGAVSRLLALRPLQWLAKYGFEFYMVQELLVVLLRGLTGGLGLRWRVQVLCFVPGAFVLSLGFAVLCQRWLKPHLTKGRTS